MEYFVSFIAFFAIYFCINVLIEPIRKKFLIKNMPENTALNKKNYKNGKDNKKLLNQTSNKKITKKEIIGILKNSLIVSFVYILVIFILKRFS